MFRRKAVPPKPLTRWAEDTTSKKTLVEIVSTPAYQTAVATLLDVASPHFTTLSNNPEQNSQRLAWLAGYRDAFADLEKLANMPVKQHQTDQTDQTEWTHLQPNQ